MSLGAHHICIMHVGDLSNTCTRHVLTCQTTRHEKYVFPTDIGLNNSVQLALANLDLDELVITQSVATY